MEVLSQQVDSEAKVEALRTELSGLRAEVEQTRGQLRGANAST